MSIIPKIKLGIPKEREQLNLSFDCATTANIGTIQPTMCREMVPNETFNVKVASLVRLRPLVVPTFGRMSLRHYHTFVPYSQIWEPFNAFMSGQRYRNADSSAIIPSATPYFTMESITQEIFLNYSDVSIYKTDELTDDNLVKFDPLTKTAEEVAADIAADITPAVQGLFQGSALFGNGNTLSFCSHGPGNMSDEGRGVVMFSDYVLCLDSSVSDQRIVFDPTTTTASNHILPAFGATPITPEGADFISYFNGYTYCFKLKPVAKRFRQILIGLGYPASPWNRNVKFNPFKLIAFYKSWFELFCPIREKSFSDTNCYTLCQRMRSNMNGSAIDGNQRPLWRAFLLDVALDTYYYLPMDYFSMSSISAEQSNSTLNPELVSQVELGSSGYSSQQNKAMNGRTSGPPDNRRVMAQVNNVVYPGGYGVSPLAMRMAMRLLTWTNKNTVVGRSIRQYLKAHFGIDEGTDVDFNGVVRIGSSRVNVQISDVMSTAETSEATLGEYAGKGIGFGDSDKVDFTAKEFGCWITLSVIVPESGYYQGYLLENRSTDRFQFYQPEFDALGYQILERGELMDDYNCDSPDWNPQTDYDRTAGFGLVPRYSHLKVGRNIVNGDLSIGGNYADGAPYTFDRRFSSGVYGKKYTIELAYLPEYEDGAIEVNPVPNRYVRVEQKARIEKPSFVPSLVFDDFRKIDPSDHFGQYNRIFSVTDNRQDHFILNFVFDVDAYAPMKSLTSSFDTVQEGDKTIEVTKS